MRVLILTCCLVAATFATPGFDACRVQPQTIPLGLNLRVLQPWQWWGESSGAERAQAICVAAAWTGTAATFATCWAWEKHPKMRPWIQAAAIVAVGGMFGTLATGALRERGR